MCNYRFRKENNVWYKVFILCVYIKYIVYLFILYFHYIVIIKEDEKERKRARVNIVFYHNLINVTLIFLSIN